MHVLLANKMLSFINRMDIGIQNLNSLHCKILIRTESPLGPAIIRTIILLLLLLLLLLKLILLLQDSLEILKLLLVLLKAGKVTVCRVTLLTLTFLRDLGGRGRGVGLLRGWWRAGGDRRACPP
jgi:hypothetical protein